MTAETDIAAIDDGGQNTAAEVRTAMTSVLQRGTYFIEESVLSVAGTITFSGIPGTYRELFLVGRLRGTTAEDASNCRIRVGNSSVDTGSNYASTSLLNRVSTSDGHFGGSSETSGRCCSVPGGNTTSTAFGVVKIWLPDYADTARRRHYIFESAAYDSTNGGLTAQGGGEWNNTADAIDIIEIGADSSMSNLAAGSRLVLYGVS